MLNGYTTLRGWLEDGRGRPVFERYDQLSWFIRKNRAELIASKTFIPGVGNRPTLVSANFDKIVERILKREGGAA
jgi:hypothetical protein